MFHTNAGAGLACASCHPGGGEDGRAWLFAGLGTRRTQLFNMGIRDRTPLHCKQQDSKTFPSRKTVVSRSERQGQY